MFIEARFKGDRAKREMRSFEQNEFKAFVGGLKKAVVAAGVGLGLREVGQFVMDTARLGAQAEDVEIAFRGVAGSVKDARDLLNQMREATKGAVSDLTLRQQAARASFLGIPIERFPELLQAARTAAIATGQDINYMLESIVLGLGRLSPRIIDNLGITIKLGNAMQEYADSIGTVSSELTTEQQRIAIINATMRESLKQQQALGDVGITTGEKIGQASAAWQDLKATIGSITGPAVAAGLSALADGMRDVKDALTPPERTWVDSSEEFLARWETYERRSGIVAGMSMQEYEAYRARMEEIGRMLEKAERERRERAAATEEWLAQVRREEWEIFWEWFDRREEERRRRRRVVGAPRFGGGPGGLADFPEPGETGGPPSAETAQSQMLESRWRSFFAGAFHQGIEQGSEGVMTYLESFFKRRLAEIIAEGVVQGMTKGLGEDLGGILSDILGFEEAPAEGGSGGWV
ncbi:MAG: hypothetical protein GF341_02780 [candidate division Zixibacteria bacterium]|nr:hypothetical protein [candidate division Zixibacteria bacterium]